ncbi:MAG: Gfo/Idh/MocA family oxidoreductase [Gordonia sp. (in: high G+C Gram-positive bacteria)]
MTSGPLRIGVLGAARIAESAIVRPAAELGHRLVAVAARDGARAGEFAEKFGVERVLDDYAAVIADPEVEVVYNPLANALHGPWNLAALRAGKPVLTEKPFSRNSIEAQKVADVARERGLVVLEAFHYLFHPMMARTFELLREGTIGEIGDVEATMGMPQPPATDPRWSYDLAGGSLMDVGCYGLHVFRMLHPFCGGPPEITGAAAIVSDRDRLVDATSSVSVRYPNGARGHNSNSMLDDKFTFRLRISGSAGEVVIHDFLSPTRDNRLTVTTAAGTRVEHLPTRTTYTYQLDAFAAAVRTGAELPIGLDDAIENMRYIDAAYRAAGLPPR